MTATTVESSDILHAMPPYQHSDIVPDETEQARAGLYRLLALALARPPDAATLAALAALDGGPGEIGDALHETAAAARATTVAEARLEYDALFIGITEGEVVPYASFYLTGFLHERPLARMREDMAEFGLAQADGRSEPEDHIATICEVMAHIVDGPANERRPLARQHAFFRRHIDPWAGRFFADLQAAPAARLFRPLATLGRLWVELERAAFLMECA
jgi:TorA maturation chaperone TorD